LLFFGVPATSSRGSPKISPMSRSSAGFRDFKLFGADPGFAVTVHFASNYTTDNYSNAGPTGLPQRVSLAGEIASIAVSEYSAILGWHAGVHHWNVILTGFAPTGNMLSDHLALTGLNRPALDLKGAYTYDAAMVALAHAIPGDAMADALEPAKLVDIDMDWLA
jgi:hypothetical protein